MKRPLIAAALTASWITPAAAQSSDHMTVTSLVQHQCANALLRSPKLVNALSTVGTNVETVCSCMAATMVSHSTDELVASFASGRTLIPGDGLLAATKLCVWDALR